MSALVQPQSYPVNVNLEFSPEMRILITISSIFGLTLTGLTFVFQLKHPKSRYYLTS